jgi:hypothetical protein
MSPEKFVAEVGRLIADGKDEQALELGSRLREEMMPKLSREQFWRVCGMMEGAQLAVDLAEAERERLRQAQERPRVLGQPG